MGQFERLFRAACNRVVNHALLIELVGTGLMLLGALLIFALVLARFRAA